jgi:excisionase family DNA binding protein
MPESLLTPKEVAQWLKMSRVWVYKQAEKGLLPFHRVGDAIRFDPGAIKAYLELRKGLRRSDHLVGKQEATKSDLNIKGLRP